MPLAGAGAQRIAGAIQIAGEPPVAPGKIEHGDFSPLAPDVACNGERDGAVKFGQAAEFLAVEDREHRANVTFSGGSAPGWWK